MTTLQTKQCACGGNCACRSKSKNMITKDTKILDVLNSNPDAFEVLLDAGLGCIGCPMSAHETIGQGCKGHGMTDEEIQEIIDELNAQEEEE